MWPAARKYASSRDIGDRVLSVALSPDGKMVASAGDDKTVRLRDVASGKEIRQLEGHQYQVHCVAFSPDGKMVASGGEDRTVRLWDVASGKEIRQFLGFGDLVWSVSFSPDGKMLASAGFDRTVRLWDVASGKEVRQLQGHQDRVYAGIFSPDGKMFASAGEDATLRLWEVCTGKEIRKVEGPQGPLYALAMSPDGKTVASAGSDKTVLVWLLPEVWQGSGISTGKLDPKQLESLWADLAGQDTRKAYQAVAALIAGARDSVPFLQERLRSLATPDAQRVARLLADLDSDAFAVREKASQELEKLGEQAEPILRKALAGGLSPEVQRRVEAILAKLAAPTPEKQRTLRAVMVLEQIGSPEAKDLLETLSKGAEGALLTEEAKAALKRMHP